MDLKGRRAIVTGASRGIGRAIAEALAENGADVALLARTEAGSKDAVHACKEHGGKAFAVAADVANSVELERAMGEATKILGGLDVLVTSAGVAWLGATHRAPEGAWRHMVDINLIGTMEAARLALPYIRMSAHPQMIFIGSVSARTLYAGGAGYCASKHGLLGFAGSLYDELRAHRVKVTTINPGAVDTDMTRAAGHGIDPKQLLQPSDVADAAMYVMRCAPRACPTEIELRCHHPTLS